MGRESALAAAVVDWLTAQRWDVYQEVSTGGPVADIVAVRAGLVWIIECKTALTFSVLRQASRWGAHLRSVAVPSVKGGREDRAAAIDCARDYFAVGVIEVRHVKAARWCPESWDINEREAAPLQRHFHRAACRLRDALRPEHKTHAQAGAVGAAGRFTPYRETINAVARLLRGHPGLTIREIVAQLEAHHYTTAAGARAGLRAALEGWESETFEARPDGKANRYYVREASRAS